MRERVENKMQNYRKNFCGYASFFQNSSMRKVDFLYSSLKSKNGYLLYENCELVIALN